MKDPFNLERFVAAQDAGAIYAEAVRELRNSRKQGHWMWFVFPQITGLGRSPTARHFAVSNLPEAQAYVSHAVLGPRLVECARILTELPENSAVRIFGSVDAQKLKSSMTLFARAAPHQPVFKDVLDQFFAGEADEGTSNRL